MEVNERLLRKIISYLKDSIYQAIHVCKAFYSFREAGNCLFHVTMLNPVFDTVIDMPFQHDLTDLCRADLAALIWERPSSQGISSSSYGQWLNLSDDFFRSAGVDCQRLMLCFIAVLLKVSSLNESLLKTMNIII